jgi:hypothetical protein
LEESLQEMDIKFILGGKWKTKITFESVWVWKRIAHPLQPQIALWMLSRIVVAYLRVVCSTRIILSFIIRLR